MPTKAYDPARAMNPGQSEEPAGQEQAPEELNYSKFVSELPEEFQAEVGEALAAMIEYIHSDEGTSAIIDTLQKAKKDVASQIGRSAMQAMDKADPEHRWSDSAKIFVGYFAVKEVALIGRESGVTNIPEEDESRIFEEAAHNYIYAMIKSKPTQEAREAEAIRIQKEVDPLLNDKMRAAGNEVAKKKGIQPSEAPQRKGGNPAAAAGPVPAQAQGGLLE